MIQAVGIFLYLVVAGVVACVTWKVGKTDLDNPGWCLAGVFWPGVIPAWGAFHITKLLFERHEKKVAQQKRIDEELRRQKEPHGYRDN